MVASDYFHRLVELQKSSVPTGICSVCSSHHSVLTAAMVQARDDGDILLVESTVNQVNQEGGYTGMTPAAFREYLYRQADRAELPRRRILLGGDHIGPLPWKELPAQVAMERACDLIESLIKAGYVKIHLDASMPLLGDGVQANGGLDPLLVAERQARMALAAEAAYRQFAGDGACQPVYVIGSDVPPPGGEKTPREGVPATTAAEFCDTIDACHDAFQRLGLSSAWERVFAVVVQLGAEFGDQTVHDYDRVKAQAVCEAARKHPTLVLEAHSTDYQNPAALRQMVEDGVAVLKVGPALTFAMRESMFALECVEGELVDNLPDTRSDLRSILDRAMIENPRYWCSYFNGHAHDLRLSRKYSLLDRCRYYWGVPDVDAAVRRLIRNLRAIRFPATLLSQFCPAAYVKVRRGAVTPEPEAIVHEQIRDVLRTYRQATRTGI